MHAHLICGVLAGFFFLMTAGLLAGCVVHGQEGTHHNPGPAQPASQIASPVRTVVGRSVEGKPIEMVRFGTGPLPALVIAAIHGDEPTSKSVADRLIASLGECPAANVAVVPCANPDGLEADRRTNAHGVDLNRNFPSANWKRSQRGWNFGGSQPLSEPESAALLRAIETLRPRFIISIHSMERPCNNYDGPGEAIAQVMSRHNGYPVRATIGYPTPGSLGSWAGIDRHIPIITLELPRHESGERAWAGNRDALIAPLCEGSS